MTASEALALIFRATPKEGNFSVRRLIEDALKDNGHRISLSLDERIDQIEVDVGNQIAEAQSALQVRGAAPVLESLDGANRTFKWACSGKRSDLQQNWLRSRCLRWLDTLSSHDFEIACALALKANGASEACASRKSGDFNTDFFGILPAHSKASLILSGAHGCRIVGQAKKYNSKVAREKVLTLVESLNALCKRQPEARAAAPIWFYEHRVPIVGVMVGFSGFQSGARNYAADHGIILLDGNDLAYLLASPRFLGWPINDKAFDTAIAAEFRAVPRLV